eukprot:TRINITY_DN80404_c0_g1_i1.p1 TRINITY_DN80404_c0_g1~~TRINITY_DN80404_c0_g1_i1.p1  ORF type:complete len:611 (-),score=115.78 TRINITY_DN80404_c0_g1_i1:99-1931(-)
MQAERWSSQTMKAKGREALLAALQLGDNATVAFLVESFAALNAGRSVLQDFGLQRGFSRFPDPTELTFLVEEVIRHHVAGDDVSSLRSRRSRDRKRRRDRSDCDKSSEAPTLEEEKAMEVEEEATEADEQEEDVPVAPDTAFAGSSSEEELGSDDEGETDVLPQATQDIPEFGTYDDVTPADLETVRNSQKSKPFRGNARGDSPVHVAAQRGFTTMLGDLLTNSASRYIRNAFGHTPLHIAARFNSGEVIAELLLILPYIANFRDHIGRTALHIASANNSAEAVRRLLGCPNVNRRVRDKLGRTCRDVASTDEIRALIEQDLRTAEYSAPLRLDYEATPQHIPDIAEQSIWYRCPNSGWTVFHHLAASSNEAQLRSLIESAHVSQPTLRALMCVVDVDYKTPYEIAQAAPFGERVLPLLVAPTDCASAAKQEVNGNVPATLRSKYPHLKAFIYAPEIKEPKPRTSQIDSGELDEWASSLATLENSKYRGKSEASFGTCYREAVQVTREDRHTVTDANIANSTARNEAGTQATCELHGAGSKRLKTTLETFLAQAVERGLTRVNIITGKGTHGGKGSVRTQTPAILNASSLVVDYQLARNHSAFYVNLISP